MFNFECYENSKTKYYIKFAKLNVIFSFAIFITFKIENSKTKYYIKFAKLCIKALCGSY